MGSFFDQKAKQLGKKSVASVLRVSRFEDPMPTLELISHIVTAPKAPSLDDCFEIYHKELDAFIEESEKAGYVYQSESERFYYWLRRYGNGLQYSIEDGVFESGVKVAVAGGYSAGKSTFLNCVTGAKSLLPVGIEPTSVVLTYLNCSNGNKGVAVRGKNVKGDKVLLSLDALSSIRHTSAGQCSVAGVLRNLVVDVPAKAPYLDGVVFIDTPGYDNSAATNIGDASSDRETALSCFDEADFIFWCVDVQKGTVTAEDLKVLADRKEKDGKRTPYAIVVTKAGLKSGQDLYNVMLEVRRACVNKFGNDDAPAAVVCFDRTEEGFNFGGLDGISIEKLFQIVRSMSGCSLSVTSYLSAVRFDFDDELQASKNTYDKADEDRKKAVKERNEWSETYKTVSDKWGVSCRYTELVMEKLDNSAEKVNSHKEIMETEENMQAFLNKWKPRLVNKLSEAANTAIGLLDDFRTRLRPPQAMTVEGSVFDAIGSGDYQLFLRCFDAGVDLAATNSGGYNAITYVAHSGENAMIKFLINHQVDLTLTDDRGRDALAEAVACHFRDICELIFEADPSIAAGRDAELLALAANDDFAKWLGGELHS